MARVGTTLAFIFVTAAGIVVGASTVLAQATTPAAADAQESTAATPKKKTSSRSKGADDGKSTAKSQPQPAAIEKSLETAQKSLDAGKADVAINQVNALIANGGLDARSVARALAIRGHAHKKQGKPAQAIADLQSALYLRNGLNDAERAAASQARSEAYREAGLAEPKSSSGAAAAQAEPATPAKAATAAAPKPAAGAARTAEVPAKEERSTPISTAAVPAPQRPVPEQPKTSASESGSGGIGGFFSNLFGGSQSQPATPAAPAIKPPSEAAVSSWSDRAPGTESKASAKPPSARPESGAAKLAAAAPASTTAKGKEAAAQAAPGAGGFKLELASVRSRAEAQRAAEKVRKEHADIIGQRKYSIVETTFGNMGTFYRAQFGPYPESVEPTALCSTLRSKGLDCQVLPN